LAWTVEYDTAAVKRLTKIGKPEARRILDYMRSVADCADPRVKAKPMSGNLAGLWRYRVGAWRVLCDIMDDRLVVYVIEVEHRSKAYR
jgi:mRNA interferase RelE/StbE